MLDALSFWLKQGLISFGGPAGQIVLGAAMALFRFRRGVIQGLLASALVVHRLRG
ncbi:hypothetical protein [Pseudomonas sp. Q1-7]|uniref:hypothetical protein n=1 Tax=Pseudomonas sp. Q1-7 TaxID=3020843 RepID=UPI0023001D38|nr:hypothetical protein [Pseudomonas sp. Q1-7]